MADAPLSVLMPPSNVGDTTGEYVTLDRSPDEIQTEDAEDGGMWADLGGDDDEMPSAGGGFYDNLAEVLPQVVMDRIVQDLLQRIDEDKKAREPRVAQYEEGIRRTGMGKDAPGGAEFEGASKVVHPMITQACIDFEARIIKELWPPSGPVKAKILGEVTAKKSKKATRKTEYMNHQMTVLIKEARSVTESTLTQVPLGGAQYIKLWFDHRLKRPRMQFVPIDKVYIPANAASYESAHRRTHADTVTNVEYLQRVQSGLYRDIRHASAPSITPEPSKAESASRKVEGVETQTLNIDSEREIYETMTYLEVTAEMADVLGIESDGDLCPYIVTIDVQNRAMIAMYRDWEEEDDTKEPIEHLFEFAFIPWRGAQAIGLPQIIGGLAAGATGALRALLDSAFIANMQGGFLLKGAGVSGQNKKAQPGEYVEIDGGLETPDIRAKVMQFNSQQPSAVLLQLLGVLVDAASGAVRTSLDETAIDTNANTPVGTQLSRVEEGLVVFSAIHGRIHASFDRLLAGLHRLNRLYLDDFVTLDIQGKDIMVARRDFEGPVDIQPVSDPTIYSDQQRFNQITAIQQRAVVTPGLYNALEVEKRFLKLLKIPDAESLLVTQPKPIELNAVNENLSMALGGPVVAFPEQDHLAHLQAHLDFMQSPALGSNPLIGQKYLPAALQHCVEHMLYHYVKLNHDLVSEAAGIDASQLFSKDTEVKQRFDQLLALVSQKTVPVADAVFKGVLPVLQAAMQRAQAMMPKPPMDPATAAAQAAAAETQRKSAADQAGNAIDQAKVQSDAALKDKAIGAKAQSDQQRLAITEMQNQSRERVADVDAQTKMATTAADNATAKEIAETRIYSGSAPRFKDGKSLSD